MAPNILNIFPDIHTAINQGTELFDDFLARNPEQMRQSLLTASNDEALVNRLMDNPAILRLFNVQGFVQGITYAENYNRLMVTNMVNKNVDMDMAYRFAIANYTPTYQPEGFTNAASTGNQDQV